MNSSGGLAQALAVLVLGIMVVGCLAAMMVGAAQVKSEDIQDGLEIKRLEVEAQRTEAEAERAEAEAEAEAARAEAEKAKADQIRAEGERSEARADAYTQEQLARVAAAAVDRQGRLLSLLVLSNWIRPFFVGAISGAGLTLLGLWVLAHKREGAQ